MFCFSITPAMKQIPIDECQLMTMLPMNPLHLHQAWVSSYGKRELKFFLVFLMKSIWVQSVESACISKGALLQDEKASRNNVLGDMKDELRSRTQLFWCLISMCLESQQSFHFAPHLMKHKHLDGKTCWRQIGIGQCNACVLGAECCRKVLSNEALLAQSGKATHAHVHCKRAFPVGDLCYCGEE